MLTKVDLVVSENFKQRVSYEHHQKKTRSFTVNVFHTLLCFKSFKIKKMSFRLQMWCQIFRGCNCFSDSLLTVTAAAGVLALALNLNLLMLLLAVFRIVFLDLCYRFILDPNRV